MSDDLHANLLKRARVWAGNVTKLANKNLGKFKKLILVKSSAQEQGYKIGVVTTASPTSRDKYGRIKNVARAYEYGSGIHSRRAIASPKQQGVKGKILIKPVRKKILAFYWDVATANPDDFVFLEDGRVILPHVNHPGVEAANEGKGYLAPAINEVRKQIRKEVPKETRDAIIGTFRKSFRKTIQ